MFAKPAIASIVHRAVLPIAGRFQPPSQPPIPRQLIPRLLALWLLKIIMPKFAIPPPMLVLP